MKHPSAFVPGESYYDPNYNPFAGNGNYPPPPPKEQQVVAPQQFGAGDRWGNPFQDNEEEVLLHHVADGDTLVGLSLTYGVSAAVIKKANGITSDEIYYLGTVKIPRPRRYTPQEGAEDPAKAAADRMATLKQAFRNRTGESDNSVVEKYLSRAAFNYHDAVQLYDTEKNTLQRQKRLVQELKYRLDKDDQDDKIAAYYLDSNNWNLEEALRVYKEDLLMGFGVVRVTQLSQFSASSPKCLHSIPSLKHPPFH